MGVKSTLNTVDDYPVLKVSKITDDLSTVVLFFGPREGMVVESTDLSPFGGFFQVGDYLADWSESSFEYLTDVVALNDSYMRAEGDKSSYPALVQYRGSVFLVRNETEICRVYPNIGDPHLGRDYFEDDMIKPFTGTIYLRND